MARVTKPCPECGGTEHLRATPTSICNGCKRLIALAKERLAEDAKRNGDEVTIYTRERHYAFAGYYPKVGASADHEARERFTKALHALIMLQARPGRFKRFDGPDEKEEVIEVPFTPKNGDRHDWGCYMTMRKDLALAIQELEAALREMVESTAAESFEKGQNLLMSIARGEVSLAKLNEANTRR